MKLSELQQGWIVETRDGELYIVCGNAFVGIGWMPTCSYKENLLIQNPHDNGNDIIKVYKNISGKTAGFDLSNKAKSFLILLWERKYLPKLTVDEITILNLLPKKYLSIFRNRNDELWLYEENEDYNFDLFGVLFKNLEKGTVYSIAELLGANED